MEIQNNRISMTHDTGQWNIQEEPQRKPVIYGVAEARGSDS